MEQEAGSNIIKGVVVKEAAADEQIASLPIGYIFHPSDEELIVEYLYKKIKKHNMHINRIHNVAIYNYHPRNLTEQYKLVREKEWYFFSPRVRKYPHGSRPNRAADNGYWKATGTVQEIIKADHKVIGCKRSLDYYEGKHGGGGKRTHWKMHEYFLQDQEYSPNNKQRNPQGDMQLDECVLYKIYMNKRASKKNEKGSGGKNVIKPADEGMQDPHPVTDASTISTDDDAFSNPTVQQQPDHNQDQVQAPSQPSSYYPSFQNGARWSNNYSEAIAFMNEFGHTAASTQYSGQNGGLMLGGATTSSSSTHPHQLPLQYQPPLLDHYHHHGSMEANNLLFDNADEIYRDLPNL